MTMVGAAPTLVGGVDTHRDVHVAAAVDGVGGVLGVESFEVTAAGYAALERWMRSFGAVARVGVEGTGAYGAGLARYLRAHGVPVVEVDRPNRQARRRDGKSDPADAIEAARAALSGRAKGAAKSRDGQVEAIRALMVAKRSARDARTKALTQTRHLVFTGPDDLRARFQGVSTVRLAGATAGIRARATGDPVLFATKTSLAVLGRRVQALDAEIARLDVLIGQLVRAVAPGLLGVYGVGVDTAASLLIAAGDNSERVRSESAWARLCGVTPVNASSGLVVRHRLNQGGDRQANNALWRIVMVRLAFDPRTKRYMDRRLKEGLSKREVIRVLKRYIAREVYKHLPR